MFASKSLLVLFFPLAVVLPVVLPSALAQNAAPASEKSASGATLTPLVSPATAITPRQKLPQYVGFKPSGAPLAAAPADNAPTANAPTANAPTANAPSDNAPVATTVARNPMTVSMAPARSTKTASAPAWSASQQRTLTTSQPLEPRASNAARARRGLVTAVTLPASRASKTVAVAPVVVAPAPPVIAPPVIVAAVPATPTRTRPSPLASREAQARELTLARMDAQLNGAEKRLDRAQTRLTEGQKQLGSVTNLLQNAMLSGGDNASGLHPFVRVARRYLGTPYVWGGESARGFDCSGFIMRVMRDLGYQALPHSAAEQFNYGKPIAKALLQPGDIVFFANTYKPGISHVGIYLGNSRFIHAANSQVGTIVSDLNSAKWVSHYAGARRLMKMS